MSDEQKELAVLSALFDEMARILDSLPEQRAPNCEASVADFRKQLSDYIEQSYMYGGSTTILNAKKKRPEAAMVPMAHQEALERFKEAFEKAQKGLQEAQESVEPPRAGIQPKISHS